MKHRKKLNNRGQGLVEYLVIVALMAVATMAILRVMNHTVQAQFARVTDVLQGKGSSVSIQTETITQDHFKKRDMGDFFRGAKSRSGGGGEP